MRPIDWWLRLEIKSLENALRKNASGCQVDVFTCPCFARCHTGLSAPNYCMLQSSAFARMGQKYSPANYASESLIAPQCNVSAAALPWADAHVSGRILGVMTEPPHERLMRLALRECSKTFVATHGFSVLWLPSFEGSARKSCNAQLD